MKIGRNLLTAGLLAVAVTAGLGVPLQPPPETTAGSFTGTWTRVEPGQRQALQIRQAGDGRFEVRFYWWTADDFLLDTGWEVEHEYRWRGFPGTLAIRIDQERSTPDRLVGRWERRQQGADKSRLREEGPLTIYRTGDNGWKLAMVIDPLTIEASVDEPIAPYESAGRERTTRRVWIMRRVARRLIAWDEIPW